MAMRFRDSLPLGSTRKVLDYQLRVISLTSYLILFFSTITYGIEALIVDITLNEEAKGDFIVYLDDEGDFLIRLDDLKAIGLPDPKGKTKEIGDELYLSLNSVQDVAFVFDEKTLSLKITASPNLFSRTIINLEAPRSSDVYYPRDSGAFLNYSFSYEGDTLSTFQNLDVANQVGIRKGGFLLLSDFLYARTPTEQKFLRLMSNVTYDLRDELERIVIGDTFAFSDSLGSSIQLGGLSYSKVYQINPYFIKNPTLSLTGLASFPSEVEVYLDGMRVRTDQISPGEFQLQNFAYYGGFHRLNVIIRDAFGREQIIRQPYYFTDVLLGKGLSEFSYNLGFIREDFGIESNEYSDLAFVAFHRYAVSDAVTLGLRTEDRFNRLYNGGPQIFFRLWNAGVAGLSLSSSVDTVSGETGLAGELFYNYQNGNFNAGFFINGFTRDYKTIQSESFEEKPQYEVNAGLGYGTSELGLLSLNFATLEKYIGQDQQVWTASYSKTFFGNLTVNATYRHTQGPESRSNGNEVLIGLIYYLGRDYIVSTSYRISDGQNAALIQAQKSIPTGEGIGFHASLQREDVESRTSYATDSFLQYNGRYGILTGAFRDIRESSGESKEFRVGVAGSVAYVGRTVTTGRPILDSFGVVRVGEIPGVSVYVNNQEVGKTNGSGKVFVPNLSSYLDNQVSINDKDIPMNYSVSELTKYVSPPLRSGSIIHFDAKKFQAITGILKINLEGTVQTVESDEIRVISNGQEIVFLVGRGGEIYGENLASGKYKASFEYKGRKCSFDMVVPESDEIFIDLGEVICEDVH